MYTACDQLHVQLAFSIISLTALNEEVETAGTGKSHILSTNQVLSHSTLNISFSIAATNAYIY